MPKWTITDVPILSSFVVRPRLLIAIVFASLLFLFLPDAWRPITKRLIAWDVGMAVYLVLAAVMMSQFDEVIIRRRAASQDEGSLIILGLTVFGAIASVAAIMHELATAKSLTGHAEWQAIALAAATVFLSWVFMQTIFALHYAHEYYNPDPGNADGGLEFPAKYRTPDYWDFIYFSFIIGTAAQTADINITSRVIRRIVTIQCVIVFFFNTTVLALAINIGASLAS
jgi:uncharacterized membrane protein